MKREFDKAAREALRQLGTMKSIRKPVAKPTSVEMSPKEKAHKRSRSQFKQNWRKHIDESKK